MPEKKKIDLEKLSVPIKSVINHPIKSGSYVYITHFENFNSIYIRKASYECVESFNAFNKQMLKFYRNGLLNHNLNNNHFKNICIYTTF